MDVHSSHWIDSDRDSFLAFLTFVYSDHCPWIKCDSGSVLALADKYGLSRLVTLTELFITKVQGLLLTRKRVSVEFIIE
jgi:hypothetical protein